MITIQKLAIYSHFYGDIDGWARSGTSEQKANMRDNDWFLIDNLVQDILLMSKGLTSEIFNQKLNEKLVNSCDDNSTIQELKKIGIIG